MQYALLTAGRARLLVTRPDTNAYGNATLNMATSFHLARHLDAPLYVAPLHPERHTALTSLECAGVRRMESSPARTVAARLLGGAGGIAGRIGLRSWRAVGTLSELGRHGCGTPEERAYLGLDLRRSYATRPLQVRLAGREETDARRRAAELGLHDGARIVTLHVREPAYKAALGAVDREKDAARNARIETYGDAIDWLVARGTTIVRFGDPLMTPLRRPGVIDLATSPLRTPALEIWCVLRSRFFIASDCGPFNLSVLTGVPCLGVNMTHLIGAYPLRPHDRYILKHVTDAPTGRELTLTEMLTPDHIKARWAPGRHHFVDNTPAEILEAVQEMEQTVGIPAPAGPAQQAYRNSVAAFLDSDYGRTKQKMGGVQPGLYLGDGWIGEEFAKRHLGDPNSLAMPPSRK